MSEESINFLAPVYPPTGYKPLNCNYPTLTEKEKKTQILGQNEEFPKIPNEPVVPIPKRELWIQSGLETDSCKSFTEQLRQELINANFIKPDHDPNRAKDEQME